MGGRWKDLEMHATSSVAHLCSTFVAHLEMCYKQCTMLCEENTEGNPDKGTEEQEGWKKAPSFLGTPERDGQNSGRNVDGEVYAPSLRWK